jgi:nicotinamide mononucleotide transporter
VFWGQDDSEDTLAVTTRPASFHLLTLAAIGVCTLVSGALLTTYTDAARPFIDAGTTVSAILCTWMVTRKILENWLYWIVINAVSVWLFMDRGLSLTSGLFALYIVLSVIGYLSWRRTMAHP